MTVNEALQTLVQALFFNKQVATLSLIEASGTALTAIGIGVVIWGFVELIRGYRAHGIIVFGVGVMAVGVVVGTVAWAFSHPVKATLAFLAVSVVLYVLWNLARYLFPSDPY